MNSPIYLTPGPTQLNDIAKNAYIKALSTDIAAISHRGERFQSLNTATKKSLRSLMSIPEDYRIFWFGTGSESWERIIQSGVIEHSHHFVNGAFSERFYRVASELKRKATKSDAAWYDGFSIEDINVPSESELIALTHNETSSGVMLEKGFIEVLASKYPEKLIAIDMVSSAPYADIPWAKVDYAFFSVQKFFGMPAGLGALIVSPRAVKKSDEVLKALGSTGSYHSFQSLVQADDKNETPTTPNVASIYVLGEVCEVMLAKGIDAIRTNTANQANALYSFLDSYDLASAAVKSSSARSKTVICVESGDNTEKLKSLLKAKNVIVGSGYGKYSKTHLRISNFWNNECGMVVDALR